ncbi:MAG: DUF1854 domain-containing protein [Rhodoferax sp.]|nr:DUF1854 domain-containing protein [Rhodoferax sp.]
MNNGNTLDFTLQRNAFGKLVLTHASGESFVGVVPVRAFPVHVPEEGISLMNTESREVAWIDQLDALGEPERSLIRAELAVRECMPVVQKIVSVSSFSTPCTWSVLTDRGATTFVLRGDEDIRRVDAHGRLLIADAHGIQFAVQNYLALDPHSRKILDRFL